MASSSRMPDVVYDDGNGYADFPTKTDQAQVETIQSKLLSLFDQRGNDQILLSQLPSQLNQMCSPQELSEFSLLRSLKLKTLLSKMPLLEVRGAGGLCSVSKACLQNADDTKHFPEKTAAGVTAVSPVQSLTGVVDPTTAAAESISSKLKAKIHKLLASKPEGCTCSEIVKATGLSYFLAAHAAAVGTKFCSPAAVLKQMQGIQVEEQNSRQIFRLCSHGTERFDEGTQEALSNDPRKAPCLPSPTTNCSALRMQILEAGGENGATSSHTQPPSATMICLHRLSKRYLQTGWPKKYATLKQDLASIFSVAELSSLFPSATPHGPPATSAATAKEVLKRARRHLWWFLAARGCAQKLKGGHLVWNLQQTAALLSSTEPSTPAEANQQLADTMVTEMPPRSDPMQILRKSANAGDTGSGALGSVCFVQTSSQLENAIQAIEATSEAHFNKSSDGQEASPSSAAPLVVACDCEGVPDELLLIQLATATHTFIFDCVILGARNVCKALGSVFADEAIVKVFHDLHKDAAALATVGGIDCLRGTLDTQLATELMSGELHMGMNKMLEFFECQTHPGKNDMKRKMRDQSAATLFSQRPLAPEVLLYAAEDVSLLMAAHQKIFTAVEDHLAALRRASDRRAELAMKSSGLRQISFDVSSNYNLISTELIEATRPEDMWQCRAITLSDDTEQLLWLLPDNMASCLRERTAFLSDICLDKGRRPHAWVDGERKFLGAEDCVVQSSEIEAIVDKLGGFGSDNRAGLERQLHRVSGIRNRQGAVIGLTMRVGRHVGGNADMVADLLLGCKGSILILGQPGCGKTTIVREVCRVLSERFNVCIVDTSNEIAGDGDVPHPCVGLARRMMVQSLNEQSAVMVQCVQNHTPDVMVIDEIGRAAEVEAARTCKQRGVRMVASAHGDLRTLLKNRELRGLVGGVETVTLGDAQAKVEGSRHGQELGSSKLKRVRGGEPTFDSIIELRRGQFHCWTVVADVAGAVDAILDGRQYPSQLRVRDPSSGSVQMLLQSS